MIASALYFVSMQVLPDELREVFIDSTRTPTSALPGTWTWTKAVFREIFNTHFADADTWITGVPSDISADLPPLVKTIEVVGTDEEELTYDEWIFQQTGFNLPSIGCEPMSRMNSLGRFSSTSLVEGRGAAYGHFRVNHVHRVAKNHLAAEPSFVGIVVGMQEQPNAQSTYEGGDTWDVDAYLRDQGSWITRLDDAEDGELGVVDSTHATINLFQGGEIRFLNNWSPVKLTAAGAVSPEVSGQTDPVSDAPATDAADAGGETYSSIAQVWAGASVLTDIGLF